MMADGTLAKLPTMLNPGLKLMCACLSLFVHLCHIFFQQNRTSFSNTSCSNTN
jgi:hypothetical protein